MQGFSVIKKKKVDNFPSQSFRYFPIFPSFLLTSQLEERHSFFWLEIRCSRPFWRVVSKMTHFETFKTLEKFSFAATKLNIKKDGGVVEDTLKLFQGLRKAGFSMQRRVDFQYFRIIYSSGYIALCYIAHAVLRLIVKKQFILDIVLKIFLICNMYYIP